MKTETRSCVPTVPVMLAGLEGHEVAPEAIMHTVPVNCPRTGVAPGITNSAPKSSRRETKNSLVFKIFSNIPRCTEKS